MRFGVVGEVREFEWGMGWAWGSWEDVWGRKGDERKIEFQRKKAEGEFTGVRAEGGQGRKSRSEEGWKGDGREGEQHESGTGNC